MADRQKRNRKRRPREGGDAFRFLCCLQIISERSVMEPFPGRKRLFCLCGVVRQKGQRVLPAAECVLEKNTAEEKL